MKRISFSDEMIRALLEGRKTMTRRECQGNRCPYGRPGDVLAATEEFRLWRTEDWGWELLYRATHPAPGEITWTSARFMPSDLARIHLSLTSVRDEPVQAITEEDARREGVADVAAFRELWWRLKGRESWERNVRVWVLCFTVEVVR